jgi:hypothetical protein
VKFCSGKKIATRTRGLNKTKYYLEIYEETQERGDEKDSK